MSRNKPDYTKFMKKPPPLDPGPAPHNEAPQEPAQEIPWAEIVPIEQGEIAFTEPGEMARFQRVDAPSESRKRPAPEPQPVPETALPASPEPSRAPERVVGSPEPPAAPLHAGDAVQAPMLAFYCSTPPVPIFTCGLFLVILAFLAC